MSRYMADPKFSDDAPTSPQADPAEAARDWLARAQQLDWRTKPHWGVWCDDELVGGVDLRVDGANRRAEIAYEVASAHRNRGIATEAARAVIESAFAAEPGLHRVTARADGRNQPSIRVLRKLRMRYEGTLREHSAASGAPADEVQFGLLRREFERSPDAPALPARGHTKSFATPSERDASAFEFCNAVRAVPAPSPYERHDSLTVATYDHLAIVRNRADIGFYVDLACRSGGPVLELGCGTGAVLLPIARAGIDVAGVDAASPMLDRCRVKLVREPQRVRRHVELVQADMRRFDLDRSFTLAIIPFGGFMQLLTHDDQVGCLRTVLRHLTAGARLALDMPNRRPRCFDELSPRDWRPDDGQIALSDGRRISRFTRSVVRDEAQQVFDFEVAFEVMDPDGRSNRVIERVPLRYTSPAEIEQLLGKVGLEIEHIYGGFDHQAFDARCSDDVVVVARSSHSGEGHSGEQAATL